MRPNPACLSSSSLLLIATLPAQSFGTIPPGYTASESVEQSLYFGSRAELRCQVFSDAHRGAARRFDQIDFRRDGNSAASGATGRSWSAVSLRLAEADLSAATRTFSNNLSNNAQLVFSAPMRWPTATTTAGQPATWGSEVRFPFTSSYPYTGQRDLVMDYAFSGGTLANGATWSGYEYYELDGVYTATTSRANGKSIGNSTCLNSGHTQGPTCVPQLATYTPLRILTNRASQVSFYWWVTGYPAKVPIALALNAGQGSMTGIDIGNPCAKFHLTGGPQVVLFSTTPSNNANSLFYPDPELYTPFQPAWAGVRVYTQAAWTHPTRQRFELTSAGYADVPAQPVPIAGLMWFWTPYSNRTQGGTFSQAFVPLARLRF